jgi:rod shape-determining protein MreC
MAAGWARWRGAGTIGFLAVASGALVALNLAGQSPLQSLLLGALRPALALAGEIDPPRVAGAGGGEEVLRLQARNARLEHEVLRLRGLLASVSGSPFDGKRYAFRGVPAQVLCRAGAPGLRRMIVVDRGTRDGVRKGMGVVFEDRAVGRVHRAEDEVSLVLLLTDPACKIPCSLLPSPGEELPPDAAEGSEGLCEGDPAREGALRVRHIPLGGPAKSGDPVVTSGLGGLFPPGMSVGTVEETADGPDLFLEVHARPSLGDAPLRSVMILIPAFPEACEGGPAGASQRDAKR